MRVGLVIYGSLDTHSGGYLYDRQLVDYLRRAGDTVEVIALPWRNYARHLADNRSAAWLRRLDGDFDVLLQDELNHPSLAWANGRLSRRAPIVAIVHHLRASEARPRPANAVYRWVERRYLRSVDAFIFNSQTTRREVERLAGARPCVVAYPGGDRFGESAAVLTPRPPRPEGPLRLLFVGNLIPRKGLHVLLGALARLPDVAWQLDIIGRAADPAYARRMRTTVRTLPPERVAWRGHLDAPALAEAMRAADVLVVPSSYEGFGIVYLEGMGFGLPAIATTAGAAGEIISDGVDGFLVSPGDAAALAECIATLAHDRALLARMSAAAVARYARQPSWEQSLQLIRDFLIDITAHRASAPAP